MNLVKVSTLIVSLDVETSNMKARHEACKKRPFFCISQIALVELVYVGVEWRMIFVFQVSWLYDQVPRIFDSFIDRTEPDATLVLLISLEVKELDYIITNAEII